jgi:RNA polymerase sigma-70 factor (ECF subfamily)
MVDRESLPDADLVRASLGGDEEAFRDLVERYKGRAFGVAVGILGDPDEALDVVQEGFVKAYYGLKDFRFGSSFYTWFYRMLVNLAIDRKRRDARKGTVSLDEGVRVEEEPGFELLSVARTPEQLAQDRQLGDALTRAIGALPEHHRSVILLREVEGLSYEEIAETMKCSVGTVMSRLHYARAKLRDSLRPFRDG